MARLPYTATQFVVSPPHWGSNYDNATTEIVAQCFPNIHQRFCRFTDKLTVCKYALASVVWHSQQSHFPVELEHCWQRHITVPVFTRCQRVELPPVIVVREDKADMRLTGADSAITMMKV